MSSGCNVIAILAVTAAMLARPATAAAPASTAEPLRVCADPNNLPFSNRSGDGFENKIAELVARELQRPLAYFWLPQRRGFVRNTLDAGRCDLIVGVPVE